MRGTLVSTLKATPKLYTKLVFFKHGIEILVNFNGIPENRKKINENSLFKIELKKLSKIRHCSRS